MIKMIWCEDINHGVGKGNLLPWKIKEEMDHFRNETLNQIVVMGERTFISIGFPLKNRTNVVLSINKDFKHEGVKIYNDIDKLIKHYKNETIYIIGGISIYEQFFKYADELIVSTLKKSYDCDRFLKFDFSDFDITKTINNELFNVNYYKRK